MSQDKYAYGGKADPSGFRQAAWANLGFTGEPTTVEYGADGRFTLVYNPIPVVLETTQYLSPTGFSYLQPGGTAHDKYIHSH